MDLSQYHPELQSPWFALIVVPLIPVLIAAVKKRVPDSWSWTFPIAAAAIGALADFLNGLVANGLIHTPTVGVACGLASYGKRPVFELQFIDFIGPAWNQLITNLSTLRCSSRNARCSFKNSLSSIALTAS